MYTSGVLFSIVSLPWDTYWYVPISSAACSRVCSAILQRVLCNYLECSMHSSQSAMVYLYRSWNLKLCVLSTVLDVQDDIHWWSYITGMHIWTQHHFNFRMYTSIRDRMLPRCMYKKNEKVSVYVHGLYVIFWLQIYFCIQCVLEELWDPEALAFHDWEEVAKDVLLWLVIKMEWLWNHLCPCPCPCLCHLAKTSWLGRCPVTS